MKVVSRLAEQLSARGNWRELDEAMEYTVERRKHVVLIRSRGPFPLASFLADDFLRSGNSWIRVADASDAQVLEAFRNQEIYRVYQSPDSYTFVEKVVGRFEVVAEKPANSLSPDGRPLASLSPEEILSLLVG